MRNSGQLSRRSGNVQVLNYSIRLFPQLEVSRLCCAESSSSVLHPYFHAGTGWTVPPYRLVYAIPSWRRFANSEELARLQKVLNHASCWGLHRGTPLHTVIAL